MPRLNIDGSGKIELTSGDAAVPCIGVYKQNENKGYLLFTVQEINGKNIGLAYQDGKMILTYPAKRDEIYCCFKMIKNEKPYVEEDAEIPYKLLEFDCHSMEEFYEKFFDNRKIMGMDDTLPDVLSKEEQWAIQEKRHLFFWREKGEYLSHLGREYPAGNWQPGWTGGFHLYPLLKFCGKDDVTYERIMKTFRHLFKYQGDSGFFLGRVDPDLVVSNDGYEYEGTDDYVLLRKSADALFYTIRCFDLMKEVPKEFEDSIRKTADAFVNLYNKYGQIGQFGSAKDDTLFVGGSTSAAVVGAGLVCAYRYFKNDEYLRVAKEATEDYYKNFALKGYTTGGPCEILSCPDSESAFGLLESIIWLYDETRDEKWLTYAKHTANVCSSWVVSYNYKFPEGQEFHRLDMKTIGSVIANIQNKHSAPGICTLSGTSLRKLAEWTGDDRYMTLYREVTETVSQYMSTDERPLYSADGEKLSCGMICERVNMSDWETDRWIGSVFAHGCWCELSNMLWLADF